MAQVDPPRDLIADIEAEKGSLSPKLQAIAEFALSNPEQFIRNTSREICAELPASEPTLIKFCQLFGYSGLSAFRIDFALALAKSSTATAFVEPLPNDRRQVNLAAKRQIARAAAGLVADDAGLLIDNGSTAEVFADALGPLSAKTIMTTGIRVAQNALAHGQHTVMLTGGRIRPNAMSMSGRMVEKSIGEMLFDTFVMSANAIAPGQGLSTFQEDEAHITRFMVGAARRVIVLADRTKFNKPSLHRICDFAPVDVLVTDLALSDPAVAAIEAQKVTVITVPQSETVPHVPA